MDSPGAETILRWLRLPDDRLGLLLLAQFAAERARAFGLPIERVDEAFIERVRQHVLTLRAETADTAALELALHAVASGDPVRAGRLYRELLQSGAQAAAWENIARRELTQKASARSRGGKARVGVKQANSREPEILQHAERLASQGRPRREWAAIIFNWPRGRSAGRPRLLMRGSRSGSSAVAGPRPESLPHSPARRRRL